jgi:phage FluMu protein Com
MNYYHCKCGQIFFANGLNAKCPKCKKIIDAKFIETANYNKQKQLKIYQEKIINVEV